jgi:hypoxanthine phosphoribosyltransferase
VQNYKESFDYVRLAPQFAQDDKRGMHDGLRIFWVGWGISGTKLAVSELKVLITREEIAQKVKELGAQISKDFAGQPVILVGVLKGAAIFLGDLARQLDLDASFDFIGVSSYGNRPSPSHELKHGWDSTGEVRLTKDVDQSMEGKNIILVEDILDTGLTLTFLKKFFLSHKPKAFKIAALLDKPSRRKMPIEGDYVGFKIPDEFVVGYGLDYAERYRNLPDVCVVPRG